MIKNYKFTLNEDERKRILSLHKERTNNQYLVSEQGTDPLLKNYVKPLPPDFGKKVDPSPTQKVNKAAETPKYNSGSEFPLGEVPAGSELKKPFTAVRFPQSSSSSVKADSSGSNSSVSSSQTITFNQGDLTGKQTVMAKLKELGLDTTNLKKTFETVINTTYGGLQKKI